ncbi:hypothetical protein Tco_1160757 [Tanacetum coccineum]
MLRKGSDFSEESIKKSWGKEFANESGSKFILRMVIVEPGVGATTWSAAHIGGSFLCSNGTLLFRQRSLRFRVHSSSGSGSTSSELEARVCIQGSYMVLFSKKLYSDFEKESG